MQELRGWLISGITRSGKSYRIKEHIKNSNVPTIFFNPKNEHTPYKKLDKSNNFKQLAYCLKEYRVVDFHGSLDSSKSLQEECNRLVDFIFNIWQTRIDFIIDEGAEVIPQRGKGAERFFKLTMQGLGLGYRPIVITQSIADIDKRVVRQCETKEFFRHDDWGYKYLNECRVPADEIEKKLIIAPQYSFIQLDNGTISNPMKV